MSQIPMEHASLTAADEGDLGRYGAVSTLAVGALLLGLLSIVTLFSLLLLFLPIITVLTALLALRQIERSEGAYIGRTPAIIGLVLALFFSSITVSAVVSRSRTLHYQARVFGEAWMKMARAGQLQRAHQLHLKAKDRQLPSSSLPDYYVRSPQARDELEQFYSQEFVHQIVSAPKDASFQFEKAETNTFDEVEHILLRYNARSAKDGFEPFRFVLVVEREETDAGGVWRIVNVAPPSGATE